MSSTSPQLAIAKASLTSALFRNDPVACDRSDIDAFHTLVVAAVQRCSPPNVQACKRWIVAHIVPSATRTAALGRFLSAFVDSLTELSTPTTQKPRLRARRKRLHVLYILNDVLHHVASHARDSGFVDAIDASLGPLFASAALVERSPKHDEKLRNLIQLWESRQYVPASTVRKIRDAVDSASSSSSSSGSAKNSTALETLDTCGPATKETPFVLPSIHGDPATPWYDLPATTWLHQLLRHPKRPMKTDLIKPLHMSAGAPAAGLVDAVRDVLRGVDQIYAKDCTAPAGAENRDVNELGEIIILDQATGHVLDGDTYYGWSRGFCEKMKKQRSSSKPQSKPQPKPKQKQKQKQKPKQKQR
ncbi:hypothetical protein TD95_005108 [Thielaviopsis punctulata]|uniref:CID domain-containing protein n=1 Tax=Thielaviopsis punctulata TaxID=72032 RepID=A0A0F4ZER3_9PEZI|nr:hypothetical protein TD95_005108 [Thielaviopsis punctulata]